MKIETGFKGKAVLLDGHLVKLNENGTFFRLNGRGIWTQISTKDLYKLIED